MDIAIGTVIFVFILVVPNTIFRRFYYTGPFSQEYFQSTPFLSFITSIIPGFLFHVSFLYLLLLITPKYFYNFSNFFELFLSPAAYFNERESIPAIRNILKLAFHYNIFLWIYVMLLAILIKAVVRRFRLDRKIKLFRFKNYWYYIFSGEILDFPYIRGKASRISFTYIDVLVNINNQTIIYNGLYYDHEISPDGYRLESLLISDVSRRFVNNPVENQGENKWYDIPGDYLLIPAGSIINMNVSYYNLNRRG